MSQVTFTSTANTHCRNRVTAERGYTFELFASKYTTALRGVILRFMLRFMGPPGSFGGVLVLVEWH